MSELTIEDTWFVTGMKGTGSNTVVADGVFVPAHRFVSVFKLLGGANDNPYKDEVLYRAPFMPGGTIVLAGPHLGLARAALDLVIEKASTRGIAYTFYDVQADAPITQLAVAKAAALIDVAELLAATIGPRELPCPRGARLRQRVTGPEVGAVPAPGSAGRLGGRSSVPRTSRRSFCSHPHYERRPRSRKIPAVD